MIYLVREWFYRAKEANGETVITNPYVDAATFDWIMTSSKAIYENGEFIAVVAFDFTIKNV